MTTGNFCGFFAVGITASRFQFFLIRQKNLWVSSGSGSLPSE
jgi:hypothetical protein